MIQNVVEQMSRISNKMWNIPSNLAKLISFFSLWQLGLNDLEFFDFYLFAICDDKINLVVFTSERQILIFLVCKFISLLWSVCEKFIYFFLSCTHLILSLFDCITCRTNMRCTSRQPVMPITEEYQLPMLSTLWFERQIFAVRMSMVELNSVAVCYFQILEMRRLKWKMTMEIGLVAKRRSHKFVKTTVIPKNKFCFVVVEQMQSLSNAKSKLLNGIR